MRNAVEPSLFQRPRTWWLILALMLISDGEGIFREQVSPGRLLATTRVIEPDTGGLFLLFTVFTWALALALMVKWAPAIIRTMRQQKAVLAFPVLAIISTLWSDTPIPTLRKAVLLLLACAFGWFLSVAYTPKEQMRILLVVGLIMAFASIPFALLLPSRGLDFRGEWKGVFSQKNELGAGMVFLFSSLPFCRVRGTRKLLGLLLQALLPFGLIVMSRSKESLVFAALLVVVRIVGPLIARLRKEQLPFALFAIAFAMSAIVLGYNVILILFNRDATLSGRTDEWTVLLYYVGKHLWLGYGYQAFWNGSADSIQASSTIRGLIHGADSAYIDTMLQFGVIGIALWLGLFALSMKRILRIIKSPFLPIEVYWYVGLILGIFLLNFIYSGSLTPGGLVPMLLAVAYAGMRNVTYGAQVDEP